MSGIYSGQILHYDPIIGKYGVFFPSDKQCLSTQLKRQRTLIFLKSNPP